jgi:hypothetical protein
VFASLVLSGTFCVIGETVSHHSLYDDADVELGEWVIAHTPIDSRFLTTSEGTHVRPVRLTGPRRPTSRTLPRTRTA